MGADRMTVFVALLVYALDDICSLTFSLLRILPAIILPVVFLYVCYLYIYVGLRRKDTHYEREHDMELSDQ